MKCPIDSADLVMTDRHGIEIDYCPTCRGVWLDRGELDKILERASGPFPGQPQPGQQPPTYMQQPPQQYYEDSGHGGHGGGRRDDHGYGGKRRRRGGFLDEIFDFG